MRINGQNGLNCTVRQAGAAEYSTNPDGSQQVKFRGEMTVNGEQRTRTIVAQGQAAENISYLLSRIVKQKRDDAEIIVFYDEHQVRFEDDSIPEPVQA